MSSQALGKPQYRSDGSLGRSMFGTHSSHGRTFKSADCVLDTIVHELSRLSPAAINRNMLKFFNAENLAGASFTQGIKRRGDRFLLNGLKLHIAKALDGNPVRIAEYGAGSSMPVGIQGVGQPWLARSLSHTLGILGLSDLISICISDLNASGSQFSILNPDRTLRCISRRPDPSAIAKFTALHQPEPFDRILSILTDDEVTSLVAMGISTECVFSHRPYLDPAFEGLFGLEVDCKSYEQVDERDTMKYDYIFARNLNPLRDLDSTVQTMQAKITDDGEARLIFNSKGFFQPKIALTVRRDYFRTECLFHFGKYEAIL